jgi:hypothetical protein
VEILVVQHNTKIGTDNHSKDAQIVYIHRLSDASSTVTMVDATA